MTSEQVDYVLSNYMFEIVIGLIGLIVLLFVILLIQGIAISRMRTLYKRIFDNNSTKDMDEVLLNNKKTLDSILIRNQIISEDLEKIEIKLATKMSKSAILKYNAFEKLAGNLSFVYVLLNDLDTGFILNGIHSNEGHYLYLKEVEGGKTVTLLSKEESDTLSKAIKSK